MEQELDTHDNRICIYLDIRGDNFQPQSLTERIGIQPTHTHLKGDIVPRIKSKIIYTKPGTPPLRRKDNAWEYNLGYFHTRDSDDISDILEKTFEGKEDLINEFVKQHKLYVILRVVLEIDPLKTPAFGFSRTFTKMLGKLNASIDVDIYVV